LYRGLRGRSLASGAERVPNGYSPRICCTSKVQHRCDDRPFSIGCTYRRSLRSGCGPPMEIATPAAVTHAQGVADDRGPDRTALTRRLGVNVTRPGNWANPGKGTNSEIERAVAVERRILVAWRPKWVKRRPVAQSPGPKKATCRAALPWRGAGSGVAEGRRVGGGEARTGSRLGRLILRVRQNTRVTIPRCHGVRAGPQVGPAIRCGGEGAGVRRADVGLCPWRGAHLCARPASSPFSILWISSLCGSRLRDMLMRIVAHVTRLPIANG
jgi:hypothetical protein